MFLCTWTCQASTYWAIIAVTVDESNVTC